MTDEKKDDFGTGLLIEGNLLACGAGMSPENRQHVKNVFHYATLVADKKFNVEGSGKEWYDLFLNVLRDGGFTCPQRQFQRESSTEASLTAGAVAVRVIGVAGTALLGGTVLADLAKMAFEKLSVLEEDARLFDHKQKGKAKGMVGMAACVEQEGEVFLVVSCVQSNSPTLEDDLLGIQLKVDSSEYYAGSAVLTLNRSVFNNVRELLEKRLGEVSIKNVLQYDI